MWFLTLLSLSAAVKAQPHQWTTHSPLTAFKQLGFDHQNQQSLPLNPSFIPYSISDFSDQQPKPELAKEESKGFQQIHHPNDILSNMGVDLPPEEILGDVPVYTTVEGSSVELPCNITPPIFTDRVRLVLYFRNDSAVPIYTYDTRGQSHAEARHWSEEKILGGRAFFRGDLKPARLVIDKVKATDAGIYRCRADFYRAPTTISHMKLDVIVPPEKPKIFDERSQEVRLKLGPYRIGDTVTLKCTAYGGRPTPRVTWWRDHALLDDISEDIDEATGRVTNELRMMQLRRSDLHSILTCQATNNNISVPASTSVKLDMHFGPLDVELIGRKDPVSVGRLYEFRCQSVGARPPPHITWWRGSIQLRENVTSRTSPDGNVTLSILNYVPSIRDAGKYMACRAENPELPDATLEDGWKLEIHYVPQSVLSLGSNLNGSNIKEGDDVYFECSVRANPKPYKISWRFNETPLISNPHEGIIVSNQSLVLQNVNRRQSGIYTCVAHNIEGDGVSNPMTLNIRYTPYCKPGQVQVFGVARDETARIACEVIANPQNSVFFEWRFNTSGETVDMPHDRFRSTNSRSVVEYVPRTELDYGSLLCWASNDIGRQREPCIFHLVPAGVPDNLSNCTIGNQTTSSLQVKCAGGYDGGLPQTFLLEAKDSHSLVTVSRIQSHLPHFNVSGLQAGSSYVLTLYSKNSKGQSKPVTLYAFTVKEAEKHTAGSTHHRSDSSRNSEVSVTPILGILVAIGSGLALVAVAIILVLKFRPASSYNNSSSNHHHRRHKERTYLSAPHLPLDRQHREMPEDECIDLEEKDPDIIPTNRDIIEEEEAFQAYAEQRRYASTLGRSCLGSSGTTRRRDIMMTEKGASSSTSMEGEKIRNLNLKGNFSRLSQEVSSYAEWTMPRMNSKGYAPISGGGQTDSPVSSSVHFAKIDQAGHHHGHTMTLSRPPRPPIVPPRYTSPPAPASGDCSSTSTTSQMESSSSEAPPAIAPKPTRFAMIDDMSLLAETPLVSASFASSLGNISNPTTSTSRHVIMIVPLTYDESGDVETAMTKAVAAASSVTTSASNSSLPRIKLLRSASLASWMPPKQ